MSVVRTVTKVSAKTKEESSCSCSAPKDGELCCTGARCGCRKDGRSCSFKCGCAAPRCPSCQKIGWKTDDLFECKSCPYSFRATPKAHTVNSSSAGSSSSSRTSSYSAKTLFQRTEKNNSAGSSSSCNSSSAKVPCPVCTFLNTTETLKCVMCAGTLPQPKSQNAAVFGLKQSAGAGAPDKEVFCSPCANQFGKRIDKPKPVPRKKADIQKGNGGKGKRKRCERGRTCPYIHEYQHGLEFHHDDDEIQPGNGNGGSGRGGGTSGSGSGGGSSSGFVPFGGVARSLGK